MQNLNLGRRNSPFLLLTCPPGGLTSVAVKFIDFKRVQPRRNKIAVLVYHAAAAQKQQMFGLIKGYLFLKLIA